MTDDELEKMAEVAYRAIPFDEIGGAAARNGVAELLAECRRARAEAASLRAARMSDAEAAEIEAGLEVDAVSYTRADLREDLRRLLDDRAFSNLALADKLEEKGYEDAAAMIRLEHGGAVAEGMRRAVEMMGRRADEYASRAEGRGGHDMGWDAWNLENQCDHARSRVLNEVAMEILKGLRT